MSLNDRRLIIRRKTQHVHGDVLEPIVFRGVISKDCKESAAHPNSRLCAPAGQCAIIDPHWKSQECLFQR